MAWTTPRTWTDGELVTDTIMNAHVRDNFNALADHVLARKSADEAITNNTLQNDDHLLFAMGTNQTWYLRLVLWAIDNSVGTADLKLFVTVPASGASSMSGMFFNTGGSLTSITFNESSSGSMAVTPAAGQVLTFEGYATTAGTSGNWQLQWAQDTTNGSSTVLKKGSFLAGYQIA